MREFLYCHYDDHVQMFYVFVFYLTCYCVGLAVVRLLGISCCLWYDGMHILYVSLDAFAFDVVLCHILGLLVLS